MHKFYKLALNRILSYKENQDGVAAIEFAMLAIPFFMLIFAILELAIIFLISSTLNHAVSEAGRQIRVGNFQGCGQDKFKVAVCSAMNSSNCLNRVRLDVKTGADFSGIGLPTIPNPPKSTAADPTPTIPNGDYEEGSAGAPMVIRATYYHRLVLPTELTRLENLAGTGIHRITASTAFRNEPFPASACP